MIDAHQHFWNFDPIRDSWITPDMDVLRHDFLPKDLAPILMNNGVTGCVAVQADQSEDETQFLLGLAKHNSFIRGVVGWVDLRSEKLRERLDHFSAFDKLKGFRHIVQGQPPGFLLDPRFIDGVAVLGASGFTYDLLIYSNQLAEAAQFVTKLPNCPIVLDHMAKPPIASGEISEWKKGIVELANFQNVHCKLSGMVTEASVRWNEKDFYPYLDVVLEAFGPSRLMYGSDWPVCLLSARYEQQLSVVRNYLSKLSPSEQEKIMVKNTINFYHL